MIKAKDILDFLEWEPFHGEDVEEEIDTAIEIMEAYEVPDNDIENVVLTIIEVIRYEYGE